MNEKFEGLRHTLNIKEVDLFNQVLKGVAGVGVEIGCLDGYSAITILESSSLSLTCIDPFIPDSMDPLTQGNKENFLNNVSKFGSRVGLITKYSYDVVTMWWTELDFLFIDGSHIFDDVLKDYIDWTPFLKKGGLLAMHDSRCNRQGGVKYWDGPSQVADEYVFNHSENWKILGEDFSLTIARKLN